MEFLEINRGRQEVVGTIVLNGSKSISNRVLIIQALCEEEFEIKNLSSSDDTIALQRALASTESTIDIGAAGTTMRFLTAYFAVFGNQKIVLTGSERMKQRPIKILVDALLELGADVKYLENETCPPLLINAQKVKGGKLNINATVSSQYLSALLLIAPALENGLELTLVGELVSRPYLEMTLNLMSYFGVKSEWKDNTIFIRPQKYKAKSITIEADWSAASYHYGVMAFAEKGKLKLKGLFENSVQGDSVLSSMMEFFGIQTTFLEDGVELSKVGVSGENFEFDFVKCPDLAQTIAVVCAGLKVKGVFKGLQTLAIKETDRTKALQTEFSKMNVSFERVGDAWEIYPENIVLDKKISIDTYHDHRMAMSFAPLSMFFDNPMIVNQPNVVSKSYFYYWRDLEELGFDIKMNKNEM